MTAPYKQPSIARLPRPSRRYERLIGTLLRNDLIDIQACSKRAMHTRVAHLNRHGYGRCHAMVLAANQFACSYQKVRKAVYEVDNTLLNNQKMNKTIKIKNEADCTVIDIEGTIGLSEEWQFDNPESRVATYEQFKECVSQIADISNSNIVVNIRSTGGDVNDAILIYEALRATGAHITTRCYGYTASAATIVAQAASEGCRLIAPTSLYLIHNSICSTEGNANELQAEIELLRQTDMRIAEIYAARSERDVEHIATLMAENGGRGRWLSPAEAISEGLADAIISNGSKEEKESIGERTKRGIMALMKAIGIDFDEAHPKAEDDINYIPREMPHNSIDSSTIAFQEAQREVAPTTLKATEDPSFIEPQSDPRRNAYDSDARSLRNR